MKKNPEVREANKARKDRRNVVKGVTLGLGGVTLTQWSKPVVQSIVLPAHAQTSPSDGLRFSRSSTSGTFSFPD